MLLLDPPPLVLLLCALMRLSLCFSYFRVEGFHSLALLECWFDVNIEADVYPSILGLPNLGWSDLMFVQSVS